MHHETIQLFECSLVEQQLDAFSGGHLAGGVLAFHPVRAASRLGGPIAAFQFSLQVVEGHVVGDEQTAYQSRLNPRTLC